MLVAQSREAGILDPAEESIVRHVFTFGDKTVEDAMTPRPEMVTLGGRRVHRRGDHRRAHVRLFAPAGL